MPIPRVSRRSFLKAALAASAAPLILPPHLRAQETRANGKITLGFIGVGIQARGLMNGFLNKPEVQVLAVCDVDTNRREAARKKVDEHYGKQAGATSGGCQVYNDYMELLGRKEIDAVVIATPDHWHALITIAAARAGKDIYCEKPLCQTIEESQAMTAAVRDARRIFQIGSQQRSSAEFRVACELVRQGKLGKISRVETGFGGPPKPCDLPEQPMEPGLDWDRWLGPAPERPYNEVLSPRGVHGHFPMWRLYGEYGGGMVTDWGAHHVDIAHWGLGMDGSGPIEVLPPENAGAESGARLIYPGGVELTHISENGVTFHGSEGQLFVNRGKFKLSLGGEVKYDATREGADLRQIVAAAEKDLLSGTEPQLYVSNDHHADWLGAIRSRKDPVCPVEVGASTVDACHLLNFAYLHGKKLQWDAKAHQFTGGTGDPAWLRREYRGAWKLS
jgi:predicted dehydrogenase